MRVYGTYTPQDCYAMCSSMKRNGVYANGATSDAKTGKICYCDFGMKRRNTVTTWKSTYIIRGIFYSTFYVFHYRCKEVRMEMIAKTVTLNYHVGKVCAILWRMFSTVGDNLCTTVESILLNNVKRWTSTLSQVFFTQMPIMLFITDEMGNQVAYDC